MNAFGIAALAVVCMYNTCSDPRSFGDNDEAISRCMPLSSCTLLKWSNILFKDLLGVFSSPLFEPSFMISSEH
jgi:hypothetical protein